MWKSSFLVRLEAMGCRLQLYQKWTLSQVFFSKCIFKNYQGIPFGKNLHHIETSIVLQINSPVTGISKQTLIYEVMICHSSYFWNLGTTNFKEHKWLVPKVLKGVRSKGIRSKWIPKTPERHLLSFWCFHC